MTNTILLEVLKMIVKNPNIISGIMPNIEMPTMGGGILWSELAEYKGFRVQKNLLTKHCRILDPEDIRQAWGSEPEILKLFQKMVK